jgi:hypothetical protein
VRLLRRFASRNDTGPRMELYRFSLFSPWLPD